MNKTLKVLMLNGSPRKNGNIALAFREMEQVFAENGIETENILLGRETIRGCIACETCRRSPASGPISPDKEKANKE